MKPIPNTQKPLIFRTDFSSQVAWQELCAAIQEPVGDFLAYVEFFEDAEFADVTKDQLLVLIPKNYNHTFIVIVDRTCVLQPDHPLLVVDLFTEFGREFRAIPSMVQSIENNLSIANMDFEEFASAVDQNGVFRGFLGS